MLVIANVVSFIVNCLTILNYLYLQKYKNIRNYTIICLICSILFLIRGILFKDISGTISEFFWIGISIFGLLKKTNELEQLEKEKKEIEKRIEELKKKVNSIINK